MTQKRKNGKPLLFTALIEKEGDGYVATCPELEVVSQRETVEEARKNLAEAVAIVLQEASPDELKRRPKSEVYVTSLEVAVGLAARPVSQRNVPGSTPCSPQTRPTALEVQCVCEADAVGCRYLQRNSAGATQWLCPESSLVQRAMTSNTSART